jgi:hypothetical protein
MMKGDSVDVCNGVRDIFIVLAVCKAQWASAGVAGTPGLWIDAWPDWICQGSN